MLLHRPQWDGLIICPSDSIEQNNESILAAGEAAVEYFEYLKKCGALDDIKDYTHVDALRALINYIKQR